MAETVLDTAGKIDLGSWNWTANATRYAKDFGLDLALAGPRMVMKLGSFLAVPEAVDNIFGGRVAQRMIPEATGAGMVRAATTAAGGVAAREFTQGGADMLVEANDQAAGLASRFSMEGARSLSNVFSYATSKWALCCIIMAIILNRTTIMASTRRNLTLPWKVRLLVRAIPIILLGIQCRWLLQSMQCQTSPDFGLLRWGNASKHSDLLFTQNGGVLHVLSSTLLLNPSDEASCLAVKMIPPAYDEEELANLEADGPLPKVELVGSLSLLWPLFKTFSFSQFIETLSCAVQGRHVAAETGMTLFEHSLAFAEADAAVGTQLGFGSFGGTTTVWSNTTAEATKIAITRSMIMKRVNTTPEVLLIGFLSSMNHLTSHALAIFNLQGRFRLINTGIWALCFIFAIIWSLYTFSIDDLPSQSLLRFPTVSLVGFVPHVMVLFGILACTIIYCIALVIAVLAPPTSQDGALVDSPEVESAHSFTQRLVAAHHNMQANFPLSNIRISLHQDFYSFLLRLGYSTFTIATEAVYLNESRDVNVKQRTWLEEDRLREIEEVGAQLLGPSFRISGSDLSNNIGLVAAKDQPMDLLQKSSSGYAREMVGKMDKKKYDRTTHGIGATERSGRWIMAVDFFLSISRLLISWYASLTLRVLSKVGIRWRPRFLVWLISKPKSTTPPEKELADTNNPDSLNFWLLNIDGELSLPKNDEVDVEQIMRSRIEDSQGHWDEEEEKKLDSNLYGWWLNGGWFGGEDSSGSYGPQQRELDEDITSVVSFSTAGDEQEWESDGNDDGRRTPTQDYPHFCRESSVFRESSPFADTPLNPQNLARLLHPKTPEQRTEAQVLAAHLSSNTIVTRSRFRKINHAERSKVLTSTRHRPANFTPASAAGKLSPEEEAQILEHLIITRRAFHSSTTSATESTSWAKGASGMGDGGPQCVVCQSSPRSIIVWPCRCLSLCDDCRVSLAMNNFDKCVCCRRDVSSFSRIFVP